MKNRRVESTGESGPKHGTAKVYDSCSELNTQSIKVSLSHRTKKVISLSATLLSHLSPSCHTLLYDVHIALQKARMFLHRIYNTLTSYGCGWHFVLLLQSFLRWSVTSVRLYATGVALYNIHVRAEIELFIALWSR